MLRATVLLTLLLLVRSAEARQLVTLHTFCSEANCADGQFPQAGLVRDSDGNLYGTAAQGGAHNQGVVFKLDKRSKRYVYKVLHSFCRDCGEGWFPLAGLILDGQGNLYGTTEAGGPKDCGTVFKLKAAKLVTLHAFCSTDDDGDLPATALSYQGQSSGAVYDGVSPLYGTTSRGGVHEFGTVFRLERKTNGKWKARTLYSFCAQAQCADGMEPSGEVTIDGAGNLYGVTALGGSNNHGVLYQIAGKTETVLWSFCANGDPCDDGSNPNGALLRDEQGNLVGTALNTSSENGVVFRKTASGLDVLHTFCADACVDGYAPTSGVVSDGTNLYGTTSQGGSTVGGNGTIYQMRADGTFFATLYNFCSIKNCTDGRVPLAPLVLDVVGNLFGTTSQGGGGSGTVFQLKTAH